MIRKGFDNKKYLSLQSEKIEERIAAFGDKLYLAVCDAYNWFNG